MSMEPPKEQVLQATLKNVSAFAAHGFTLKPTPTLVRVNRARIDDKPLLPLSVNMDIHGQDTPQLVPAARTNGSLSP